MRIRISFAVAVLLLPLLARAQSEGDRRLPWPTEPRSEYGRSHDYDLRHLKIEVRFDPSAGRVIGTTTNTIAALALPVTRAAFDAVGFTIAGVSDSAGRALRYAYDGSRIDVTLAAPLQPGAEESIAIRYEAAPKKGLYFINPDAGYPNVHREIWSQGEMEDNRFWMATWDFPNDKATSELIATVPRGQRVISNGKLVETKDDAAAGTTTWHWREDYPHATYLNSIVVGEYAEVADKWKDVPVLYYVPPGREEEARRSFGKTPQMIDFFSTVTGYPYPYEKYAQTTVSRFTYGGMENISATTQTVSTLHSARAHQDVDSDSLVAHELAHQWWGDNTTTRDWANAWLNEGFATYFQQLWFEHDRGVDAFALERESGRESYFNEDQRNHRRPIVSYTFRDPEDMFDRHTYQKGGAVLHMLRRTLGDQAWWAGIHHYIEKFQAKNVVTADFRVAMEEATGRDLGRFFDQWVNHAGYPELTITSRFRPETKSVELTVAQTQKPVELTPEVFVLDTTVELLQGTAVRSFPLHLEKREATFFFPAESKPDAVLFDPNHELLTKVTWDRSEEELTYLLGNARGVLDRIDAAKALGKKGKAAPLVAALKSEPYWGVRRAIVTALGEAKGDAARAALLDALASERESKVRSSVAEALGKFDGASVEPALARALVSDDSDYVRAAAATALAAAKAPGAPVLLTKAVDQKSNNGVIASAALRGLGDLKERKAIPLLARAARYGAPEENRPSAVRALGKLDDPQADTAVEKLATDPLFTVRNAVVESLRESGSPGAVSTLRTMSESDVDARIRARAAAALKRLEARNAGDETEALRKQVEELKRQLKEKGVAASPAP